MRWNLRDVAEAVVAFGLIVFIGVVYIKVLGWLIFL